MDSPSKSTRHSPSPCFQSFSAFTTFLVEFHKFNGEWNVFCFFIELQWKGWEPYPALCYSRSAQCLPHALSVPLFCLGDRPKLFGIFSPRIFLQFQLLTVFRSSGLPKVQTSRTSHCLMWLLQHLKEMCGPRILPPIQIHWPSKKWKPSHGERKLQSQLEIYRGPLRNNEQGISSYHKNIQMPKWMGVPKILGPYKPLVPVYETGELFELYSTSYEMWNCQNSHPFVCFTKCLGVDQQRRGWKKL